MAFSSGTWNGPADMIVTDPIQGVRMIVEVKTRFPSGPLEATDEWRRLLRYRDEVGAAFALLIAPDHGALALANGEIVQFDASEIAQRYGLSELPRLHGHMIAESGLYHWLTDLTMGGGLAPLPNRFPDLSGDEVLRAA